MPTASPEAAAVLLRECAELLQRRQNHGELGARVREVLLRRAAEGPTQDQVAETLGEEGPRTGRSWPRRWGTMAGELLDAGLPVERVAHRLGYADASSFSVAFQRWTGRTPGGRGWERRSV